MTTKNPSSSEEETNVVETLQSLIVAFALAMSVRSFVTEGFVIPTGSMAPTLMGAHVRLTSPATGYTFPADAGMIIEGLSPPNVARPILDPMLSLNQPLASATNAELARERRMGDRVLVLKYLYAFQDPQRWDVVVFKNPTDPNGDAANFIKRLVGLPNEQLLMLDGDIFTAPIGADRSKFTIARKPEHVQRTVWQEVCNSDYAPIDPALVSKAWGRAWTGGPWEATGFDLGARGNARAWRHDGSGPASLTWRNDVMQIVDFTSYNMWQGIAPERYAVSDVRVSGAIEAEDPAALRTAYVLETRGLRMRYAIEAGKASIRIETSPEPGGDAPEPIESAEVAFDAPAAGAPFDVEFWHVDQRCSLWVNGEELVVVDYAFGTLEERLLASFNGRTVEDYVRNAVFQQPTPPALSWSFEGSPLSLRRVRVDRDLYYRQGLHDANNQYDVNGSYLYGPGFA